MADAQGWPDETRPGVPLNPEKSGWHWLRRIDAGTTMPPVIWTWRADAQVWRAAGLERTPAEQAETKEYIAPVAPHDAADRLKAAVAQARREALEEAARVAEAEPAPASPMPDYLNRHTKERLALAAVLATKRSIAAAIRALVREGGDA